MGGKPPDSDVADREANLYVKQPWTVSVLFTEEVERHDAPFTKDLARAATSWDEPWQDMERKARSAGCASVEELRKILEEKE